ncbi:neuropeptide receptor A33 [Aphomia sociella]
MDSDLDIQNFLNCTQQILGKEKWASLNVTQLLDLLPSQIIEDINLRITLGNCMGLGERPFSLPWWGQLAWYIVFAVMLLLAISGNILVIWIVIAHRRMRTVTNCFLVNLAIADLLMATLNGAPNFVFLVTANWPFGSVTCTASNFTANLTVSAGVLTLVAITVDRYVAIVKPLQHRLSRKVARAALVTVWCSSALLALPSLLYSDTYRKQYINGQREICFIKWPDGSYPTSKTDYCYNLVFLAVTYVVPMLVMVWAYARMSAALRGRAIGECTHHQMQVVRAKRKPIVANFFAIAAGHPAGASLSTSGKSDLPYFYFRGWVFSLANEEFCHFAGPGHLYHLCWEDLAQLARKFRIYFRLVLCWCSKTKSTTPNDLKKLEINKSFSDHSNATELFTNGNALRMNPRGERDDEKHIHVCDDRL